MDFSITIRPDLNYYKEAYSEIIKFNGLKRFEPYFATAVILAGLGLLYFDNKNVLGLFPILFTGLGIFELVKVYYSKSKWLNDRTKSGVIGQELSLHFTDNSIIHSGPFSNGEMKWTGIKTIGQTDKGVIIKPETGIVIYLPKSKFTDNEQINSIIKRGQK